MPPLGLLICRFKVRFLPGSHFSLRSEWFRPSVIRHAATRLRLVASGCVVRDRVLLLEVLYQHQVAAHLLVPRVQDRFAVRRDAQVDDVILEVGEDPLSSGAKTQEFQREGAVPVTK